MEGLPWIEGNDWPLAKVDSLYYDDHHLRGVGAELYSEWLAGQSFGPDGLTIRRWGLPARVARKEPRLVGGKGVIVGWRVIPARFTKCVKKVCYIAA